MEAVTLHEIPDALTARFAADPAGAAREQERRNVEMVAQMIQSIAAGDFEALQEFMAPGVTLEIAAPPEMPWVRRATGPRAVASAVANNFGTVRDQLPQPLALVAQGDTVMLMARETGAVGASGTPYHVLVAQMFRFEDGRLAEFRGVSAFVEREPEGT